MTKKMAGRSASKPIVSKFVLGICLATALPFLALNATAQQSFLDYTAGAYGTYAVVGNLVSVAKTAPVGVGPGCGTAKVGVTANGTVASVNAFPLIQTGVINTSASDATNMATGSSDVHGVALLAGLIVADEIKAVSTTTKDGSGYHVSSAGSNLVNMLVAGIPIVGIPAPNTTIQLAGIGRVVLNEQITSSSSSSAHFTVNMVHVYVTVANILNIKVGTQIIIADAYSGLTETFGPGTLDGNAYGTAVFGKLLSSSPTAPASVGCRGNNLITNTLVGITIPQVLSSGTIIDTAQGSVTSTESSSQTSDSIQGVNLLAGIVTADAIQAGATGTTTDGVNFNFNTTSSFVNLKVAGHPEINDNVPANTKLSLAGLGTLYLRRIITTPNSIDVHMIELVVGPNVLGLPLGLDVVISRSEASLHSPNKP